MIEKMKAQWAERSPRERLLLGIMAALLLAVLLWLAVLRPVEAGLETARARQAAAQDRNAAVRAKLAALERLPRSPVLMAPVDQIVAQSAAEAGFTLERNNPAGEGRTDIAIASAKPTALFAWLAALEDQGVVAETLTAQPAGGAGTISVQALLKASGR